MEILSARESPCNQHCTSEPPTKLHAILTVSSSSCSDVSGPTHTARPAWCSVAVTGACEVVVQLPPSSERHDGGGLTAASFAECRGVDIQKSFPDFVRVSCASMRDLVLHHPSLLSLPLSAANILASDVSTRSTIAFAAPVSNSAQASLLSSSSAVVPRAVSPPKAVASDLLQGAACCAAGPSAKTARAAAAQSHGGAATKEEGASPVPLKLTVAARGAKGCFRCGARSDGAHRAVQTARALPTVALIVRAPLACGGDGGGRGLLLLRPAVQNAEDHRRYHLTYTAALWPLSESVRRVALTPCGGGAYVLGDRFAALASVREGDADTETHLVLRGGCVELVDGQKTSPVLGSLVLHVGLCGSSGSRLRALRSLLRGAVSCMMSRCGASHLHIPQQRGEARRAVVCGVSELALYSTEGHVLVFQPVPPQAAQSSSPSPASLASETRVYTCSYGTRLSYAVLRGYNCGCTSSAAVRRTGASLTVAPPWRFLDQWRHTYWLRAALECAAAVECRDDGPQHRRRRHPPSSVLATSANRRTWLITAGTRLSVVSVPSERNAAKESDAYSAAQGCCCSACVVAVDPRYTLHDVQFVQSGSHCGFLLLCRVHSADGGCRDGGSVLAAASYSAEGHRYIHGSPSHPLRVFFLSLVSMLAPGEGAPMPAALLALPVRVTAASRPTVSPLFHPSHRLRFVCVTAPDDAGTSLCDAGAVYVTLSSSGSPCTVWTGVANILSFSTWCSTHLLRSLVCTEGCGGREGHSGVSLPVSARLKQWLVHALSAAWPCTSTLAQDSRTVTEMANLSHNASAPTSLETVVEVALLRMSHERHHPVQDILESVLRNLLGVVTAGDDAVSGACAGEGVACVTATFAAFSAALRINGMTESFGLELPSTVCALSLLHSCAQTLRWALEQLCAAGHVSALLACVSHLTSTVAPSTPPSSSPCEEDAEAMAPLPPPSDAAAAAVITSRRVWQLLLQPLFDLVWSVTQDYGMAPELTRGLVLYSSPALRAMAKTTPAWWGSQHVHKSSSSAACTPAPPPPDTVAGHHGMNATQRTGAPASASLAAPGTAATQPYPITTTTATTASAAPAYTSAELYEVVRRVFLLQGAAAALRLVQQLRQHESTRDGAAEMALMYEAMQKRLDDLTA